MARTLRLESIIIEGNAKVVFDFESFDSSFLDLSYNGSLYQEIWDLAAGFNRFRAQVVPKS